MSGVVGVIATELGRYTLFTSSMLQLQAPPNTDVNFAIGSDFAHNRNRLVRTALENGAEWVFFMDDDHAFAPNHLMRLHSHDRDMVASLYLNRGAPYHPVAYGAKDDDGTYWPVNLVAAPESGLVPIVAAGTGGMLIRSEVFYAIEDPWFEKTKFGSEDLSFCDKAIEAGFEIFLDLEATMGHMATMAIWPSFQDGSWQTGFTMADGSSLMIPAATMPE